MYLLVFVVVIICGVLGQQQYPPPPPMPLTGGGYPPAPPVYAPGGGYGQGQGSSGESYEYNREYNCKLVVLYGHGKGGHIRSPFVGLHKDRYSRRNDFQRALVLCPERHGKKGILVDNRHKPIRSRRGPDDVNELEVACVDGRWVRVHEGHRGDRYGSDVPPMNCAYVSDRDSSSSSGEDGGKGGPRRESSNH
ncbi:unnamed protein product, partial [Mesorhabditis belari]|uniref:Uncharacterized protein n=1 Tax=Mesorhabditis belari TaxID=2138241 RepID=A0AAF3EZ81_9BILA